MWRTRKRLTTDTAAGEPDSERTPATLPNPNRNAYILMGIGGGVLAVFGLAAIAGIFAPVVFAFVLTICAHPLRLALEKRGVPRGLATGSVITVVTLLLIGFGCALLVAISRFGVLLNDYSDDLEAARRYMVVTTMLGLAQGIIDSVALLLLGVPGAFIWGLLAFVCLFIPNIGYFIALIPPVVFGALEGGWPTAIAVVLVYAVVNGIIQSVLQPRIIGKAVSLSQAITFFSVLFWAVVVGPIGAILAIPLTLLVRLLRLDTNPSMTWIRPMLGDVTETKQIMADSDAAAKAARAARKVGAAGRED